jgi:hypothetical protein
VNDRITVNRLKNLFQVEIELKIIANRSRSSPGEDEFPILLANPDYLLSDYTMPPIPLPLPAKHLTTAERKVQRKGSGVRDGDAWHAGELS